MVSNGRMKIPQLYQRVGLLSLLLHRLSSSGFNAFSNGLFNSKINNCLEVVGNVWGYTTHDTNQRRFSAFSKNCNCLQVIQDKLLRLINALLRADSLFEGWKEKNLCFRALKPLKNGQL